MPKVIVVRLMKTSGTVAPVMLKSFTNSVKSGCHVKGIVHTKIKKMMNMYLPSGRPRCR